MTNGQAYPGENPIGEEVLESVFIEMDPVVEGFSGVFVELVSAARAGEEGRLLLRETAARTGDTILTFSSASEGLARVLFESEVCGGDTSAAAPASASSKEYE